MTLALCIALPAFLLLFAGILNASHRDRVESDLARAVASTAKSALAAYDRDLYQTFGLFGLTPDDAEKAIASIGLPEDATQSIAAENTLFEPAAMKDAVARHMSIRSALALVQDALDKIGLCNAWGNRLAGSALIVTEPDGLFEGYKTVDPDLPDFEEKPEWLDEYNAYMDDNIRAVYQESLTTLAPVFEPDPGGAPYPVEMRPFEKGGLTGVGALLDRVFQVPAEGILDRVMLTEYCLGYLASGVPFVVREGVRVFDETPDGRVIASFPADRSNELEYVAVGRSGDAGFRLMKFLIGLIRFGVHLISIAGDPSARAHYEALGVTIAATVATLSLGTVVIPPEAVAWMLMTAASIKRGAADVARLCGGEEVALWPGEDRLNVPMRYRDYARLVIAIQAPDVIARRLAEVVSEACPGEYYTAARARIEWHGVSLEYVAGYLGRAASEVDA